VFSKTSVLEVNPTTGEARGVRAGAASVRARFALEAGVSVTRGAEVTVTAAP